MGTHRKLFLADRLRDVQIECAWATHRLSFEFEGGTPEWREQQRRFQQKNIDWHRINIAKLRAQLGVIESDSAVTFGDDPDLPKFLRAAE